MTSDVPDGPDEWHAQSTVKSIRLSQPSTAAGLAAARARGHHGGRGPVLTGHKLQVAHETYCSGRYTVSAIATTLGVSRASIYRHLDMTRQPAGNMRSRRP
jgi:DNA invertase Pin-like site-specific DNA recombinase